MLGVFLFSCLFLGTSVLAASFSSYPRLANYYLKWSISEVEANQLAKWDVVILDMETQVNSSAQLKKLKQLNPDIILLAYLTPQEILNNPGASSLRQELSRQIPDNWYLKNPSGGRISAWAGTSMLNITAVSPVNNDQKFNQFLAQFVTDKILATGLWDGVFYDNAWENLTSIIGAEVDANNDGVRDSNPNLVWQEGLKELYNTTRSLNPGKNYFIVGNATTDIYRNYLNGNMSESFPAADWNGRMRVYKNNQASSLLPRLDIINANTANSGRVDYQNLRFGLGSTLLQNGYFSYDYGNADHGQTWWYDEYDVNLGSPNSPAVSQTKLSNYSADIWQRDFANGLVLVNSTPNSQTVSLGGEYEKIHGVQDKSVNTGEIVTETKIDGYDGLILLKTFASLQDVLFRNGDFLRFFDSAGNRVRNGFFVFESTYKGGDKIAHIDLDGNGARDLLVVHGSKIMAWRDDGQIYMNLYPYTVNYQGELKVALGDLNADGLLEVYVAPAPGYPLPIKIYTRHGRQMKRDWFPFGEKYFGGYSLALGSVIGGDKNDLVIAKASQEPRVSIFDYNYNLVYQWLAFSSSKYGANVAVGNVDGVPGDEIIIGAGSGGAPVIRVFDKDGKQKGSEFTAYNALNKPGIEVLAVDVNYDGKEEIIGESGGF